MKRLNEKKLIKLIRLEYKTRLLEALDKVSMNELDVIDPRGNQLLSPGLKVKHKQSGYEYTVDRIEGNGDDTIVYLKLPEEPRFDPPHSQNNLNELDLDVSDVNLGNAMGIGNREFVNDPRKTKVSLEKKSKEEKTIQVSKKELEKDYEVE